MLNTRMKSGNKGSLQEGQASLHAADLEADAPLDELDDDVMLEEATPELDLTTPDAQQALRTGTEVIADFVKTLPTAPGVYRMIGLGGEVLYVGKAKNLRVRVSSYARGKAHNNRIGRMIALTKNMEFVITSTETEALLLETNYIKQLRPRFNVLMRDDKSFPYIFLSGDHPAPQISKHRGARNRRGQYYGPFASIWAVSRTIDTLQRAFLLRTCTDSFYENRKRPCLQFQIKRCAAPCTNEVSPEQYMGLVTQTQDFLSGKSRAVKESIAADMQEASDALEFERAAQLRDRLSALSAIQASQDINPQNIEEADVFAIHTEAGQFCIEAFFFRMWQNWGSRAFYPKADRTMEPAEVLDAFLAQFYNERPPPRLILLSETIENQALLGEALSSTVDYMVELQTPKRGDKHDLVKHALKNAREALSRKLIETASQEKLLAAVGQAFGMERAPRRIDVFDNSHIMGTNAIGGMIVAGAQGFMKTHYRTFNIKGEELTPGDDYAMMREVLARRFSRLLKEEPLESALPQKPENLPEDASLTEAEREMRVAEAAAAAQEEQELQQNSFPAWPDLVLIDGGKGQLSAVQEALKGFDLGKRVTFVAIAKGPERNAGKETFFMEGRPSFKLPERDPALYFVQRLRDEAHRFAIGTHRAKRKKALVANPLDEIAGIGPARKRALLLHFGSAKAVAGASLFDLMKVSGLNAATAQLIFAHFHEKA